MTCRLVLVFSCPENDDAFMHSTLQYTVHRVHAHKAWGKKCHFLEPFNDTRTITRYCCCFQPDSASASKVRHFAVKFYCTWTLLLQQHSTSDYKTGRADWLRPMSCGAGEGLGETERQRGVCVPQPRRKYAEVQVLPQPTQACCWHISPHLSELARCSWYLRRTITTGRIHPHVSSSFLPRSAREHASSIRYKTVQPRWFGSEPCEKNGVIVFFLLFSMTSWQHYDDIKNLQYLTV